MTKTQILQRIKKMPEKCMKTYGILYSEFTQLIIDVAAAKIWLIRNC